ncbi:hypothetical protein ACFXG4_40115 [Nocardia sp. NPDC059246]
MFIQPTPRIPDPSSGGGKGCGDQIHEKGIAFVITLLADPAFDY